MTDRYFYADVVKVLFMAKHFGMTFEYSAVSDEHPDVVTVSYTIPTKVTVRKFKNNADLNRQERIYIHPESLPLLEPREGDIGLDAEGDPHIYLKERKQPPRWHLYTTYDHRAYAPSAIQIIQRDGKAFFWPEKES
jgi:hypothetical protein